MVQGSDFKLNLSSVHDRILFWKTKWRKPEYTYLGIIGEIKDGLYRIEQRNKFSVGEVIEIMKPDGQNVEATVEKIIDEDGNEQESAPHPKQVLYVALSADASVYDILRRAEKETE